MSSTISDQVAPAFVDSQIRYPVIGRPPLLAGATQDRLTLAWKGSAAIKPSRALTVRTTLGGSAIGAVAPSLSSWPFP